MSEHTLTAATAARIESRIDVDIPSSTASMIESLGHLGEAAVWFAAAQGSWPPLPLVDAVEVGVTRRAMERHRTVALLGAGTIAGCVESGIAAADAVADEGRSAILLRDSALSTEAACALVGLLTGADAASVTRSDLDSAHWMATAGAARDMMRQARPAMGDALELLAAIGDHEIALIVGVLLGAAARRTPVLLDCVPSLAAALVAHRLAYRASTWWICSHRPAHPASDQAIDRLDMHPFVDVHLAQAGMGPDLALGGIRLAIETVAAHSA